MADNYERAIRAKTDELLMAYIEAARARAAEPPPPVDPVIWPACRYCGADCSDARSWDGGDLYACRSCADHRSQAKPCDDYQNQGERQRRALGVLFTVPVCRCGFDRADHLPDSAGATDD